MMIVFWPSRKTQLWREDIKFFETGSYTEGPASQDHSLNTEGSKAGYRASGAKPGSRNSSTRAILKRPILIDGIGSFDSGVRSDRPVIDLFPTCRTWLPAILL